MSKSAQTSNRSLQIQAEIYFPDTQFIKYFEYNSEKMSGKKLRALVQSLLENNDWMCIIVKGVPRNKVDIEAHAMANIQKIPGVCDCINGSDLYIYTTCHTISTFDLRHRFFPFFLIYDTANICYYNRKPTNQFKADMAFFDEKWIQHIQRVNPLFKIGDLTYSHGTLYDSYPIA